MCALQRCVRAYLHVFRRSAACKQALPTHTFIHGQLKQPREIDCSHLLFRSAKISLNFWKPGQTALSRAEQKRFQNPTRNM